MTTPILPTKTQLAAQIYSPADLIRDADVETFLSVTNNYDFILKLMQAYRSGQAISYNIDNKTYITNTTEFVYFATNAHVSVILEYITAPHYKYLYTAKIPVITSQSNTVAWTTISYPDYLVGSQSYAGGFEVTSGPNTGKYCILVSWA
jgi:hypothetical protein